MRVAALYDIHANLPALEAVLQDIRRAEVDSVVVGGDVLPGPMPRETIACLLDLDIPVQFIQGNGDREVLALGRGTETGAVPEQFREVMRWTAEQLQPADEQLLAGWPETLRIQIGELGEVLFCHATPRNDTEIFTRRRGTTRRYLPGLLQKTGSCQSLQESTFRWSSADIPTCSLTERSEGFES